MNRTILVTGFEPFGSGSTNASWEAVKRLPESIGGWKIEKLLLPVVYDQAGKLAIMHAEECGAAFVVSVGLAGSRDKITPEMTAVNLRHASIPDNSGAMPSDLRIKPSGPDGIFSRLPVRKMAERLSGEGIPSEVSYSAGTFVCNDVFYMLLDHFKSTGTACGFIHVPHENVIEPQETAKALLLCLEMCVAVRKRAI